MKYLPVFFLFGCWRIVTSQVLQNGNVTLSLNYTTNNGILITLSHNGVTKLSGQIGMGMTLQPVRNSDTVFRSRQGNVDFMISNTTNGFNIYWRTSTISRTFQDCYFMQSGSFDWFNGREGNPTEWPVQNLKINNVPYIVSEQSSIAEAYWLNSKGGFIFVNETTPLFVDQNNVVNDGLCLISKIANPYASRAWNVLNYSIGANENAREAHRNAIDLYLGRPTGQPQAAMVREPIWSTWGKYQDDINDKLLTDLGQSIASNGFRGQVQIEDDWEECPGSLTFKKLQFAGINQTVISIQVRALRVTLTIHPFIRTDCAVAGSSGYLLRTSSGTNLVVSWRNSSNYLIDFTNQAARNWFSDRVQLLADKHVLDGFKFDNGEASWASSDAIFIGDQSRQPNGITANYNSISNFTQFVHVHSGWRTQWVPVFVSIGEKQPNWSQENGLRSVIVNLFQLNLAGYTMVLPGLIGGKSLERPTAELYVRWTQAVTFMPAMQFGHLPWEIIGSSFDVFQIVKKCVDLHYWYTDGINNIMRKSQYMGLPVNAPVWWIDPTNAAAFNIVDQYTLGDNILIAPVLTEGTVSRDVYLPPGQWEDGNNGTIYDGSRTLIDYPAGIDVLPYFLRHTD